MSGKVHCWWEKVVWRHQCIHAEGLWYRKKYWLPRASWMWMCNICPKNAFYHKQFFADFHGERINKIELLLIMVISNAWPFINLYQMKNNANLLRLGWKVGGLVWSKSRQRGVCTFSPPKFAVKRQRQKLWNCCSSRSMAIMFYSGDHDGLP